MRTYISDITKASRSPGPHSLFLSSGLYGVIYNKTHTCSDFYYFLIYLWGYCGTKSTITAAIYWPIVPALDYKMMMVVEQFVECIIGRRNRRAWRRPAPVTLYHRSHLSWPGLGPGPPPWEAGDCLSYDTAIFAQIIQFNSIPYYLCAESTATRPITDTAQCRYT
jgi:hypothetical protein